MKMICQIVIMKKKERKTSKNDCQSNDNFSLGILTVKIGYDMISA